MIHKVTFLRRIGKSGYTYYKGKTKLNLALTIPSDLTKTGLINESELYKVTLEFVGIVPKGKRDLIRN